MARSTLPPPSSYPTKEAKRYQIRLARAFLRCIGPSRDYGLRQAFHEAVEDYLDTCAKIGKEPQKAYPAPVMFRVGPETHRKAALAAELCRTSPTQ